jgi:hypothetical protein
MPHENQSTEQPKPGTGLGQRERIVLFVSLGILLFFVVAFIIGNRNERAVDAARKVESDRVLAARDVLAAAIRNYVENSLPALTPSPTLNDTFPLHNDAVWWIGGGRGGPDKPQDDAGALWHVQGEAYGPIGVDQESGHVPHIPRFEDITSLVIVKGKLVSESKTFFRTSPNMPETLVTIPGHELQAWVVDMKSNKVVAYRDFPPPQLPDSFSGTEQLADIVDSSALRQLPVVTKWIGSLETTGGTKDVVTGAFTFKVPSDWPFYPPKETSEFRKEFVGEGSRIYRQFSGSDDPTNLIDLKALHIPDKGGSFVAASFSVPLGQNAISLLMSQAKDKARWGVQNGYVKQYLGLFPVDDRRLSGFYVKMISSDDHLTISGGIALKESPNTLLQLTLTSQAVWHSGKREHTVELSEGNEENTFKAVLETLGPASH